MQDPTSHKRDVHDPERGATMLEYGLLITLIGLAVAASLHPFGSAIASLYSQVSAAFT